MTDSQHTPGPWEVSFCDDGTIDILVPLDRERQEFEFICSIKDNRPVDGFNAELIAQAPALKREHDDLRAMLISCATALELYADLYNLQEARKLAAESQFLLKLIKKTTESEETQ